ncbi:hypothetical protein [Nitrosomonas mobilis]|uniref:hypothetical protein n=1 Tax=Nitrosomonas mobilis TaxID=51642 RepID=UPI000B7CFCFD|nr:hypothetical protein [Nitrosomonas mobilis]
MIYTLFIKYKKIYYFLILLMLSGHVHSTYILEDRIEPGEDIKFSWTRDGNPNAIFTFRFEILIDGETVPISGFSGNGFEGGQDFIPVGKGASFKFVAPKGATDWQQTIILPQDPPGPGGEFPKRESFVIGGNIISNSPFAFHPLDELPNTIHHIPDLAPSGQGGPGITIYTAVNLDLYIANNPLGFNDGNWIVGDTLSSLGLEIIDGQIAGLEGIVWSLTPFEFDPNSVWGFVPEGGNLNLLNSVDFGSVPIEIVQRHIGQNIPEPGILFLILCGLMCLYRIHVGKQWYNNSRVLGS